MTQPNPLKEIQRIADAARARFGAPETLVAEFPRNATERICVERSGDLVRILTRGSSVAHAADYEATAYECHADHLPELIAALQKARGLQ